MATIQADGLTTVTSISTDNNGGTVKANGNISGTFEASAITQEKTDVFGSTPIDNNSANKVVNGVFAYNNQSPVAKKLTNKLATVDNTYLISGASDPSNIQSIHKIEGLTTRQQTLAIREGNFNIFTGKYDTGYPTSVVDSFGTDEAANPTRDVPGRFTYIAGDENNTLLTPKNDTYKSKTN